MKNCNGHFTFLFMFPTSNCLKQNSQELWSASTVVLKIPRRSSFFILRCSYNSREVVIEVILNLGCEDQQLSADTEEGNEDFAGVYMDSICHQTCFLEGGSVHIEYLEFSIIMAVFLASLLPLSFCEAIHHGPNVSASQI